MKEDAKPSKDSEDAFYNSQKFEVLYCGKVTVTHKKAPSSLIDDCIEKFSLHEQQRLRIQGEQRGPDARSDPVVFEVEGPSSPSDILLEEGDGVNNTHPVFPAVASQPGGLSSSRFCFPERILEDSGFDEQQEFRSRCSSVTGVLQRKVHENSQKPQARRRHASAPSHVQPSDSEKNRTMLFQVLSWRGLLACHRPLLDRSSQASGSSHFLSLLQSNVYFFLPGKQIRQMEQEQRKAERGWQADMEGGL